MNNLSIIEKVNEAIYCFENEYGINLSNKGFNVLKTLVSELKNEVVLSGYKGSDKKRVQEALKYQKEMFENYSANSILGLCNYASGYQYIVHNTFAVRLQHDNIIKELKSTDDDFDYISKKRNITFKHENSKRAYPQVEKIFKRLGEWNEAYISAKDLMNKLSAEKREVVYLRLNDDLVAIDRQTLTRMMILSNLYDSGYVKVNYQRNTLKPLFFNDDSICVVCRTNDNESDKIIIDSNIH